MQSRLIFFFVMFSTHEYNTTNSAKLFHDGCAAGGFMKCCYSNCNNWNGLLIIPCVRKCFWHGHSTPSRAMTYVGPCCYTSSPFSCGLFFFLLPLDVCVYITRCAICVYLNYLNIYPGYQLFFSPLPFFFLKNNLKKRLDGLGGRVWPFMTPLVFWHFTNCIY